MRPHGLRAAAGDSGPTGTTVVRPLGVRDRPEGYLAVLLPGRPDEAERVAVGTGAALISLALERRRERRATDRGLRERALQVLLGGDPRTARMLLAATSGGGTLPRRVQVLRGHGPREAVEDARERWEDERLLLCVAEADQVVVVAPAQRSLGLVEALAATGLRVGVGSVGPLDEVRASHTTAGHALAETSPGAPVRTWEELARGGVVGLLGQERAEAFARSYLAPLADREDLLLTLGSFLRHHGSRGEVAAELGVHRNTVRNRVEQVERLLGVSLDDPQARADAWVALRPRRTATDPADPPARRP